MNDLVSVGELMREFHIANSSQIELLREHGIRSARCNPRGRGYAHFVTPEDAATLRLRLRARGKRPRSKDAQASLQFDAIGVRESFWSRLRQAFRVLAGA